jgi:hypothetical protein
LQPIEKTYSPSRCPVVALERNPAFNKNFLTIGTAYALITFK